MKDLKTDPITTGSSILLVGIGNSGRADDGLGWEFVERISILGFDSLDCEFRYQLQIEDAAMISNYDVVVFVDATREKLRSGFQISPCIAAPHAFFTTHAEAPGAILYLTNELYTRYPKTYTLVISGTDWELGTSLSNEARNNLDTAVNFFLEKFLPTVQPDMMSST
jgi:hydrogenase maturation protease